jgi:hypothetical protein
LAVGGFVHAEAIGAVFFNDGFDVDGELGELGDGLCLFGGEAFDVG